MKSIYLITLASAVFNYGLIRGQEEEGTEAPSSSTTRRSRFSFPRSRSSVTITENPLYPSRVWVPAGLTFSCHDRAPGYYSDPSPASLCQAYHLCMPDGRRYSMLCGIGTVFNQRTFVCDHWYSYDCSSAERDYRLNNELWEEFLLPSGDKEPLAGSESRIEGREADEGLGEQRDVMY